MQIETPSSFDEEPGLDYRKKFLVIGIALSPEYL